MTLILRKNNSGYKAAHITDRSIDSQNLKQRKSDILSNLKEEPSASASDVIKVVIKLPNGTRLERRFLTTDSMKVMLEFTFLCSPFACK